MPRMIPMPVVGDLVIGEKVVGRVLPNPPTLQLIEHWAEGQATWEIGVKWSGSGTQQFVVVFWNGACWLTPEEKGNSQ